MNAIQHAINEVKHRIPKAILHEIFIATMNREDNWARRNAPIVSVDHRIRSIVIEGRVIPHINLTTGQRTMVPLTGLVHDYQSDFTAVITIPKDRTQGRSISQVFSIVAGTPIGTVGGAVVTTYGQGNDMIDGLQAVKQSRSPIPLVEDANIHLIGDNKIHLTAPVRQSGYLYLDCLLENDRLLSRLAKPSWECFAKLVEYATKAYIFNEIIIPMDEAYIKGGSSLGRFREVVDGYSDANDNFEEQLKIWRKVSILTDPQSFQNHIQSTVGGLF